MTLSSILVTGVSGFVGGRLADSLDPEIYRVVGVARNAAISRSYPLARIASLTDFSASDLVLNEVDVVIHVAARVHVMNDSEDDPLTAFRDVNVKGTLNLARQAAAAGVKRFIFISSIKVNGEQTAIGQPFSSHDTPAP